MKIRKLVRDRVSKWGKALHKAGLLPLLGLSFLFGIYAGPLQAQTPVVMQLKWTHAFQFAGYYMAEELGYYREAGFSVRFVEGSADLNPVDEVLAGRADFGVGTSSLLLARARGEPV